MFKGANCPSYLTLNSAHYTCNRNSASGASLYLYIPAGELKNLPFGGIWDATLKLRVKRRYDQTYENYTINITVKLTDKGNIQIWLPQFKSDAHINLTCVQLVGAHIGRNSVDMCFYDGYSTNSSSLELRFQDNNPKSDGKFYLRKINDDTKEIAYTLSLLLAGKSLTPTNGTSIILLTQLLWK
ncbi:CfaE/CblD family pilus tip adhesin [Escherichia coli]